MPTTVFLAHAPTNRRVKVSTTGSVIYQGYPDGYWEITHMSEPLDISPQQVRDGVEVLKTMGWVVVDD